VFLSSEYVQNKAARMSRDVGRCLPNMCSRPLRVMGSLQKLDTILHMK